MRKIREVLRLSHECGLGLRQVARSLGLAHSTVREYVRRAREAGVGWPLPEGLTEAALDRLLFPPPTITAAPAMRAVPDWAAIHQELRRKGVTLFLLWHEYRAGCPEGFGYSWFCEHYRAWAGKLDLVMRQDHRAGEKLFVDYAGQTVDIVDRVTGAVRAAQIFVAVLGASSYAFAEATWTQGSADWVGSHVRAMAYFGGSPELYVPDNLKSGVTHADRYEPLPNASYREMAEHYGVAILPARAGKPRDKAKAEAGVLVVERWILAALRHRTFFSLAELNEAIAELLEQLNARPFRKLPGSRRSQFEALDRPALRPLPASPYEYAQWLLARVHIDYHVEVDKHFYSVPYQLVGEQLDVRLSSRVVEVFRKGARVASHVRSFRRGGHTTVAEHMPKAHREYAKWTPERLVRWAQQTGDATAGVVEEILRKRAHPQQGFRSCLGLLRLGKKHGDARLEAACARALTVGACSYKSVESILRQGLDRQPLPNAAVVVQPLQHPNVRGAEYYH